MVQILAYPLGLMLRYLSKVETLPIAQRQCSISLKLVLDAGKHNSLSAPEQVRIALHIFPIQEEN